MKKLHFTGKNEEFVRNEFHEMRDQILIEKENTVRSYKEAFAKPSWRKRIFLACGIWIGVSLTGITSVNFYRKCSLRGRERAICLDEELNASDSLRTVNTFIKNLGFSTSQSLLLTGKRPIP